MTRYLIVRYVGNEYQTHPQTEQAGYDSATEASLEAIRLDLNGAWFIHPVNGDVQPARVGRTEA